MPLTLLIPPLMLALGAAQTASVPPPASGSDIVVEHRTNADLTRLIDALASVSHDTQIARWNDAICVRTLGVDDVHGALIQNRIGIVAKALGITVINKKCRPNIVILATTDADAFARAFLERFPDLWHDPADGIAHGTEVADFVASRPVRWIDATRTGNADGAPILGANHWYGGGSHIQSSTRENTVASIAIVDMLKMTHIDWGQLADYLTLVTLARPKPSATVSDSVLSIFAARDAGIRGPAGLTATDEGLLRGLYHSDASLSASRQRSQIADHMRKPGRR